MTSDVDLAYAAKLPPEKAVAYFQGKGLLVSDAWHEVWQEAHAQAFTVARAATLDVLTEIHTEAGKILTQGTTERELAKALTPRLKALGWWGKEERVDPETGEIKTVQLGSPHRLKTIYRTNAQTAYMAGRWKAFEENRADRPYLQYVAVLDSRTRPAHRLLDGKVWKMDDPALRSFHPPNGWGCRCRMRALSVADLTELGLDAVPSGSDLGEKTVTVAEGKKATVATLRVFDPYAAKKVTVSPDPGWSYNPGPAWLSQAPKRLAATLEAAPAALASGPLRDAVASEVFEAFLMAPGGKGGFPVLRLKEEAARAIGAKDRVALLSEASAAKNLAAHPELTLEEYRLLPELGEDPTLIVQDGDRTEVLIRRGERLHWAAVKATQSGEGTFVTSFRRANKDGVAALVKKGKVLYGEW